jgi:hypothetical protein
MRNWKCLEKGSCLTGSEVITFFGTGFLLFPTPFDLRLLCIQPLTLLEMSQIGYFLLTS